MREDIKLTVETNKGTLVRVPTTIDRVDGRIFFAPGTPFALKNDIKSMKGSKWHGYIPDDNRKIWSVEDCTRNNFQLEFMTGGDPYANWDQPLKKHEYTRPLFEHQKLMSDHILTYHYQILAAEMGCIDGDAVVHCHRAGRGFKITLRELCYKFHGGATYNTTSPKIRGVSSRRWDSSTDTYIRGFRGNCLGLTKVLDVVFQGKKKVLTITTESGKALTCTPDHEICVGGRWYGEFKAAQDLKLGDKIMVSAPKGFVKESTKVLQTPPADLQKINGNKAPDHYFVFEEILGIEDDGETDVYDVKCEGPYHNFVADEVIVSNCGKTLSGIEAMERSNTHEWWYIAPKSGIAAVELEFEKWGLNFQPKMMTYERLRILIEKWEKGQPAPVGVFFDESSRAKTATAKRTKAAMHLADSIRAEHGWNGYVILMSGTPSPKSPVDWWAQAEICYPGFIKEGSVKAFEWRLGIFQKKMTDQGEFWKRVSWRDDDKKCNECGEYAEHENHSTDDLFGAGDKAHTYIPSKNEVAYLYKRLEGLVLPLAKKDCLDIPDKIYREIKLEPTTTLKRVAKALAGSAISVIQGLTWLRELSDGFQYTSIQDGEETCPVCKGSGECEDWYLDDEIVEPEVDEALDGYEKRVGSCSACDGSGKIPHMVRETKEIKCPKEQAVRDLLEENEDQGRLVIFAGFQGSVDRIVKICHKKQWDVVKVDGRGWKIQTCDGEKPPRKVKPLSYWADLSNERVVFVAHPASGGMGLTLTESRMAVFYSNDFTPESRAQAEDRIHRPGIDMNRGATIVDLFHLGTDQKVLNVLRDNRRLEKLTLGEMREMI
jgi:hypothetical protein